jgi:hypothetical protein
MKCLIKKECFKNDELFIKAILILKSAQENISKEENMNLKII